LLNICVNEKDVNLGQITDNLSLLNLYENNGGVVEENSGVVESANQGQEELFDLENGENCCICWDSKV
jgi:hypothetical protein